MMSEEDVEKYIPKPRSKFVKVRCKNCNNEMVIFSHASRTVYCLVCGEILAQPTGGKAEILGEKIEEYG